MLHHRAHDLRWIGQGQDLARQLDQCYTGRQSERAIWYVHFEERSHDAKVWKLTCAILEHTLLVTEDGVEVLTARLADSPGGKVEMPGAASNGTNGTHEAAA